MHDPMTQAFQICYPWRAYKNPRSDWERSYRAPFITIWHVDPERDGSDDSCDWFGRKLTAEEKALAAELVDNEMNNVRTFFSKFIPQPCSVHANREECYDAGCHLGDFMECCTRDEMRHRVMCIFSCYKRNLRWRYPVRWHFWHWRFQVHPLREFKRWAFSRCCRCGKRFAWGYSPVSESWDSEGPRWFRTEQNVWHQDCDRPAAGMVANASPPAQ